MHFAERRRGKQTRPTIRPEAKWYSRRRLAGEMVIGSVGRPPKLAQAGVAPGPLRKVHLEHPLTSEEMAL